MRSRSSLLARELLQSSCSKRVSGGKHWKGPSRVLDVQQASCNPAGWGDQIMVGVCRQAAACRQTGSEMGGASVLSKLHKAILTNSSQGLR